MDPARVAALQARLLAWFALHRRPLPFRQDRTPYRVLVAEVMLQQTRAEAVEGHLRRFCARFPDVASLAAAEEQQVLAEWQGLGYYSRARNLHRAARRIVAEHGGELPREPAALRSLPGVGPYIAAAVGAFAFGRDEAALDANAVRVLSRLFAVERADRALAQRLLPAGRGADWNEALMDFGSMVCVPRRPRCLPCPLADLCAGRERGLAETLPVRPPRRPRPEVAVVTLVVRDAGGRLGLVQRPPRGLLAGMWEFPSLEGAVDPAAVAAAHRIALRGAPQALRPLRHTFTHRVWNVRPYAAVGTGPLRWVAAADLPAVPLSGPAARALAGAAAGPPK